MVGSTSTSTSSGRPGRRCRRSSSPSSVFFVLGLVAGRDGDDIGADDDRAHGARRRLQHHPAEPAAARAAGRALDPQGAGLARAHGCRRCSPACSARSSSPTSCAGFVDGRRSAPVRRVDQGGLAGDGDRVLRSTPGIAEIDRLLSRGGMDSMLPTVWLIIGAVTFGALLEEFGLINRLIDPLIRGGEDHRAPVPHGVRVRLRAERRRRRPVHRARAARRASSGPSSPSAGSRRPTCRASPPTAARSPRRSCRGTRAARSWAAVLGVSTLLYLPYASSTSPARLLSVLYGFTGFKVEHLDPATARARSTATDDDAGAPT